MLEHTSHRLADGVVVHRWRPRGSAGHTGSAGSRPAVMLQHGFREYAERYVTEHQGVVAHLVDAGCDVWAMDLWGHGQSPGRRGVLSASRAVDDHLAVRRLVARHHAQVVLIGHSLGGFVTAASVARDDDVAGVVLLAPALERPAPAPVRRVVSAGAALAPGAPIPRRARPPSELSRVEEVADRAALDPRMSTGQVGLLLAATVLREAPGLWDALPRWTVPTVVAHGSADTYTDPTASADLVSLIASADKELWSVPGAFHELLHEQDAARLVDRVVARVGRWVGRPIA